MSCKNQSKVVEAVIINGKTGIQVNQLFTPFYKNIIADSDLPGLAVGVVKDNEIVYARGFGYLDNESQIPMNISSLFLMASVSKPFVATAIMQLVEQNKINLDSTVISYLPYFKLVGRQYDQITIGQMLNHISGMPDVTNYQWENPVYDDGALESYVRSISSQVMISSPGEQFAYSNMAYECVGDVIAKVSKTSFAEYVKLNILNPSGRKETAFLKPESLPKNWANPHLKFTSLHSWEGYPYNRMHGPSSTLHSNAKEM